MDISKYADYFHDGSVNNISHTKNNISFSIESAEIEDLYEIVDKDFPSKSNRLKGVLNIYNIKTFKLDNKIFNGIFQMQYEYGSILELEINDNKVFLLIEWKNFRPKLRRPEVSEIEIEAEKIQWVPDISI